MPLIVPPSEAQQMGQRCATGRQRDRPPSISRALPLLLTVCVC
jgi:hypothetical protein